MNEKMNDTYVLGISAFYHDAAAALLKNGKIIAAVQEERFTRKKHDPAFPRQAIRYCLKEAAIAQEDLDFICFYEKPFLKFERLLTTYLAFAPKGIRSFLSSMPSWITQKIFLKDLIEKETGCEGKVFFCGHHEAHGASAFYPSPFQKAAILTIDGVGEWETASYGVGEGNEIRIDATIQFPHSLGLLYSAFTYYAGFRVNSGEYKLMGLAPFGEPRYAELIKKELIDIKEDGSFRLNLKYFDFCTGLTMTNKRFSALFAGPARRAEIDKIEQRHMDLAASIQLVAEEVLMKMAVHVRKVTGQEDLCLAGGVALNCVANGKIRHSAIFKRMWVQPAATDAGGALGAALALWHRHLGKPRSVAHDHDSMNAALLGPHFSDEQIEVFLTRHSVAYERLLPSEIPAKVAKLLTEQNVLGWFQGRVEYGPRALGARSILADPRSETMQSRLNLKIKFRESFRPFAPSVLAERCADFFEDKEESPYMLFTSMVKKDKRVPSETVEPEPFGIEKLKIKRSVVPCVTHVDYSARIQTVRRYDNPLFYDTIEAFFGLTGCPMVVNTSFNVRGEPIVCSPEDAFRCFMNTDMDYALLGSFLLHKARQTPQKERVRPSNELEPD